MIFMDGTNFDRRVFEAYGVKQIDHAMLWSLLTNGTHLDVVHYCYAYLIRQREQERYSMQRRQLESIKKMPNVRCHEGQHRSRGVKCGVCRKEYDIYVEKGTDVNLSSRLVHAACHKAANRMYVITSDNDFVPAMQIAVSEGVDVRCCSVIDPSASHAVQLARLGSLAAACRAPIIPITSDILGKCFQK
jgi:hypothetical protein